MKLTAHAYITQGGTDALPSVAKLLEENGIRIEANPDVYMRAYAAFTIDDARELRDRAALRAVGKHGRIFVIVAPAIAPDAQNALLKTFEEPPRGARFILVVPSPGTLLPTLRSRAQMLDLGNDEHRKSIIDVRKFLGSTSEKRIDMLKPLLEKDEDPEKPRGLGAGRRDLAGAIAFLSELERALSANVGLTKSHMESIRAIYRARKYITDRGALVKSLLEQMALLIPRVL